MKTLYSVPVPILPRGFVRPGTAVIQGRSGLHYNSTQSCSIGLRSMISAGHSSNFTLNSTNLAYIDLIYGTVKVEQKIDLT